jgi:ribosomal protein S12 methylthiotransferase
VEWIRLHYAYPADFPLELLPLMRTRDNICNYLDIALQHANDAILKKMRRNITREETIRLIKTIREDVPGIHLRTTLMVGFPDETSEEFAELLDFVCEMQFERLGAFIYSEEEGTWSAQHYKDSISAKTKQERFDELMRMQETIAAKIHEAKIGQTLKVIIDREEPEFYIGRSEYESPEIDPEILIDKNTPLTIGEFYPIRITSTQSYDLFGSFSTN